MEFPQWVFQPHSGRNFVGAFRNTLHNNLQLHRFIFNALVIFYKIYFHLYSCEHDEMINVQNNDMIQ